MKFRHSIAALLLASVGFVGCDFQAAEDAFEDFDLIIELEPINTVINGIVVDGSTGQLVSAQLQFSGTGAGVLVDAYSDPISSLNAESGLVTFGIQNAIVPTASSPFELTVTATADGYYSTSQTVQVTEVGEGQFTIGLSSSNFASSVVGTTSRQDASATTGSGGAVTQTVTVQTTQTPQTNATASVTVPQGSVPLTAAGTPLSGQITTQIRSYDSASGLQSLPAAARLTGDGTNQAVGGAVFFKMSDSSGNVAINAQAASSGVVASKSSGICTGGIQLILRSTDAALRSTYDQIVQAGGTVDATVWAYTPADGQNNQVSTVLVEKDGAELIVELCLGGSAGSTGVIDPTSIGSASEGIIFTFAFGSALTSPGELLHNVTLGGFTGTKNIRFNLSGPALNKTATVAVSPGTYPLKDLVQESGTFRVLNQGSFVLSANYQGSTAVTSESMDSPLVGNTSLSLPASSDLETYNVTASLQCDDPTTQKFEVQITSQSLDAVSAFYRIANAGDSWTLLPNGAITSKTATDSKIEIKGSLDLKPSSPYEIQGVLGNDTSTTTQTTPAAGGDWTIELSTDDVGISCENR